MKLIDLIGYLKSYDKVQQLIEKELPDVEIDQVDTYLIGKLDSKSEVKFFDAESIPNNVLIEVDGIEYINLFPLSMLQEMVEGYKNLPGVTDLEVAEKVLQYRIKDA